jgi:hypothetical protein
MTEKLKKWDWRAFFELMTKALDGKRAEIEIASLKIGHQIEAEWLPFRGMSYDPKNDVIDIVLEGLNHIIHKPQEVFVERQGLELSSLEVIDGDNLRQIIVLRDPLMLPPPSAKIADRSAAR